MLTGLPRAEVASLVAGGAVRVADRVVTTRSRRVAEGEWVEVVVPEVVARAALVPEPDLAIDVVHADDDVIVVDKQAGLVVHPGAGVQSGTLVHGLLARYPDIA